MTTYYFIRHAAKEHNGLRDPHLTKKGKAQAQVWADVLADKNLEMIYCTDLIRTQETVQPLAKKLNLDLKVYDKTHLYDKKFQKETKDKVVLVVGHQDTTPAFVNRILREDKYPYIESSNHGNLYRITIDDKGNINSNLSHIRL